MTGDHYLDAALALLMVVLVCSIILRWDDWG